MGRPALVFVLTTEDFYAYPEVPPPQVDAVLVTPVLTFYCSAEIAARQEEGLNFVEGDVAFFAADGSSLRPVFSREPYINHDKNTYFPGVYTLQSVVDKNLTEVLRERIKNVQFSDDIRIIVDVPQDEDEARARGWKNAEVMEAAIEKAVVILPDDLKKRIIF